MLCAFSLNNVFFLDGSVVGYLWRGWGERRPLAEGGGGVARGDHGGGGVCDDRL